VLIIGIEVSLRSLRLGVLRELNHGTLTSRKGAKAQRTAMSSLDS